MAATSNRHLAPFGGITRIRFKGFVYDVSAIRLPRYCVRIGRARSKST
jgi:hypothetical protein